MSEFSNVSAHITQYKVVLVGDAGVGKTTFVNRIKKGEFERKYIPTIGVDVVPLEWYTTKGYIVFNMWDTAGQEKFGILRDGYYKEAQAAIIMFDVTARMTYKNVPNWYDEVTRKQPNILCVLLGNKVDLKEREVKPRTITFYRKKNIQYYELSVKSNYNYEKPFIYLLRKLTNDPNLQLLQQPNSPTEVNIDFEHQRQQEDILKVALQPDFPTEVYRQRKNYAPANSKEEEGVVVQFPPLSIKEHAILLKRLLHHEQ